MAGTPPEVAKVLEQLEPLLTRWYHGGTLGEIAVVFGNHQMQPEERPRRKHEPTKFERSGGRTGTIKTTP